MAFRPGEEDAGAAVNDGGVAGVVWCSGPGGRRATAGGVAVSGMLGAVSGFSVATSWGPGWRRSQALLVQQEPELGIVGAGWQEPETSIDGEGRQESELGIGGVGGQEPEPNPGVGRARRLDPKPGIVR